jgi:beta-phosphoglucomutase-like phosphatase (HAD superfamily)
MPFQGIIFDFNGVLWWDGPLQVKAWQEWATRIRGVRFSREELGIHIHGRTNGHALSYLMGRSVTGEELDRLIQQKESLYRALCIAEGNAFALSPGAVELLDFLVACQIPRTIATASERTNLDFFVAHLNLDRWFDIDQIIYDDGQRPGKPAPHIYLDGARNLGLPPGTCIVVEDALSGIEAARTAGIGHIIAMGPEEEHDRLRRCNGVATVIMDFHEFPKELFLSA